MHSVHTAHYLQRGVTNGRMVHLLRARVREQCS